MRSCSSTVSWFHFLEAPVRVEFHKLSPRTLVEERTSGPARGGVLRGVRCSGIGFEMTPTWDGSTARRIRPSMRYTLPPGSRKDPCAGDEASASVIMSSPLQRRRYLSRRARSGSRTSGGKTFRPETPRRQLDTESASSGIGISESFGRRGQQQRQNQKRQIRCQEEK